MGALVVKMVKHGQSIINLSKGDQKRLTHYWQLASYEDSITMLSAKPDISKQVENQTSKAFWKKRKFSTLCPNLKFKGPAKQISQPFKV